ncbi:YwqI/YxiC family protein [Methanoplanus endosymbiosus]|uniref:YwqI/YxiC family protein n=1 Tax=Methanoplanus endosymbiosus TaxID=33865 RepID=A0A9E7PQM7_9EURY|nr:YwqI/YxiC family protein [Methanoplanus endosymbiosus]UUX93036.1 YwqI/YxiC family protein [Methanoplanus endosymbiosus]
MKIRDFTRRGGRQKNIPNCVPNVTESPVLRNIIVFCLLIAALSFAGCISADLADDSQKYPGISYEGSPEYEESLYDFKFRDNIASLNIPVDSNLYNTAKNTDKSAYLTDEESSTNEWSKEYYKSFINDPDLEETYGSVISGLQGIKTGMNLDDDGYAELITAFVQSIPYKTDNENPDPKFPVETVYEKSGDCDDKSILLAGLLQKEGYDVVLFEFIDEEHMGVGILSPGCGYAGTDYAYIEATDINLIGWPDITLDGDIKITEKPFVIPVAGGDKGYGKCKEVMAIYEKYQNSGNKIDELEPEISRLKRETESLHAEILTMDSEMEGLETSGKVKRYNDLVPEYNSLVKDYQALNSEYKDILNEYNGYVEIHNMIIDNQHDRQGLYEYLF